MTEVQGSRRYANMMLEHVSIGLAIYDASNFNLLDANPLYMQMLEAFLSEDWRGGKALGHSLYEWGEIARNFGVIEQFQSIAASGKTMYIQEYFLPNQQQEMTYWNSTIQAIQNDRGEVSYLVQSLNDVSEEVRARKKAEQDNQNLSQVNGTIEAERKRLEIIEAIARTVQGTLDTKHVGDVAIKVIQEQLLNSAGASIHIADHMQQLLRLLCMSSIAENEQMNQKGRVASFEKIPLGKQPFLTWSALEKDEPIVIEDVQDAVRNGKIERHHPLVQNHAHGYICLPLRFNDYLEGMLTVIFSTPIQADGIEALTLKGCGTHIAAALAHARLHASVSHERERLRTTLDQLPEGILIAEISTGTFSYANQAAAEILGIPLSELLHVPLHTHRWHRSAYTNTTSDGQPILPWNFVVVRALCGEHLRSKETLVVQPGGDYVVTLASTAPLYGENGITTSSVLVLQDITAQKSLEQHKNDFLSIANHELRTPITVIQGFAEILQIKNAQDDSLDEMTQQALSNITEQSEHLTSLIETMLDISRIEQDHFILKPTPCNLLAIVTRAIDTYAVTTRDHQIKLILHGLEKTESINAYLDGERIGQMLHNLLSNAIKYNPGGGIVEVGVYYSSERQHEVQLWIKDEGIGISADALPHIFKRFYRASNLDPSLSGFGIGLYLVKEIVVRHGGNIWVESTKGQGTTFHITLPLNKEEIDQALLGKN